MCSKGLSPFLERSGVPEAGPLPSELEVRAGGAPMRHTPVTAKLSSEQATGALAEGTYTQCPKPVPASQRGREAIARGLSDFILEQQGPETKATWGMCLRGVWSTPDARMWSEGLFVQQWERGWFLTGGGEARMLL